MATGRLLGVTALPLFSKSSSDFCVNLLIFLSPSGDLVPISQREENRYLCLFHTQAFETHYWGCNIPRQASFPEFTHDMVSDDVKGCF